MRIEVLKQTSDDWYGSYYLEDWYKGKKKQMFVEVIFNGNISPPGKTPTWRTCVWGNDDCGMEYDCDTEVEAFNMFLQVIGQESVTREFLSSLGFVSA